MNPRLELTQAIITGNLEQFVELIPQADLTEKFECKEYHPREVTLITFASILQRFDYVQLIAENKRTDLKDEAKFGSALIDAVMAKQHEAVKALINAGANQYWRCNGVGALYLAVKNNDLPMVELLLEDRNKRAVDEYEMELAWESGFWKIVICIAKSGKCTHYVLAKALLAAVKAQEIDAVTALLAAGANKVPSAKDKDGEGCLHAAVIGAVHDKNKGFAILSLLLNKGIADIYGLPLHTAIFNKDIPTLEYLLAHNFSLKRKNTDHQTAIHFAAVKAMQAKEAANSEEKEAAEAAKKEAKDFFQCVEKITTFRKATEDSDGFRVALDAAVYADQCKIADVLLAAGAPHNQQGKPCLLGHLAVGNNSSRMVAILLKHQVNMEGKMPKTKQPSNWHAGIQ